MQISVPLLVSLAYALTAGHFLRQGQPGPALAAALLALLAFGRRAWLRPVLALGLVASLPLWLHTAEALLRFRLQAGLPWLRLAAILGAVTALCCLAALLLAAEAGRRRYHLDPGQTMPRAACLLFTVGLLAVVNLLPPRSLPPLLLAERFAPTLGWLEVLLLGLYASWACGRLLEDSRRWRPRLWLLFSAAFFSQLLVGLAGVPGMLMSGRLHLPVPALILAGPLYRGQGMFMLGLFAVAVLLVGPGWCSHLCYIGSWDNFLSCLSGNRSAPLWKSGSAVRAGLAAVVLLSAVGLRLAGAPLLLAAVLGGVLGLGGVGVMFLASRVSGRMDHCTVFCPLGLAADLLGRLSPWRLVIGPGCSRCRRCAAVCRYGALEPVHLAARRPGLSCSLCGDCLEACPDGQLAMGFPGLRPEAARVVYVVLVTALHAVFLGVARM